MSLEILYGCIWKCDKCKLVTLPVISNDGTTELPPDWTHINDLDFCQNCSIKAKANSG